MNIYETWWSGTLELGTFSTMGLAAANMHAANFVISLNSFQLNYFVALFLSPNSTSAASHLIEKGALLLASFFRQPDSQDE